MDVIFTEDMLFYLLKVICHDVSSFTPTPCNIHSESQTNQLFHLCTILEVYLTISEYDELILAMILMDPYFWTQLYVFDK